MRNISNIFAFSSLIGLLNSVAASLPTFSAHELIEVDSTSSSLMVELPLNFSTPFASSGWEQFAPNFDQSGVLSIPEHMRQQGMQRVRENLQRYVDQFSDEISIAWVECFETPEDREQGVNAISSRWTSPEPFAALEWIRMVSEPDELPAALNRALQASEEVSVDENCSFVQYEDFSTQEVSMTVVPEPSAYAMIVGLISCAVIVTRRITR